MKIPKDIKKYVKKRRLSRIVLCLGMMAVISIIFFYCLDSVLDSSYTKIRIAIYIVAVVLPVFIFNIPKLLFEQSFVGTIMDIDIYATIESDVRMGFFESLYRRVRVNAVIELENGKRIHKDIASKTTQRLSVPSKFQKGINESFISDQYKIGDTIIYIAGTKYCQIYSKNKENLTCVVCGNFSNFDNTNCENCGHTIVKG